MRQPKVTKEYKEDHGERDAEGFYDYAYTYWEYIFDFDDRRYRARIHTDAPEKAFLNGLGGTNTRWSEAPTDPYIRAIADYLETDVGRVEVHILSPSGGYDPVLLLPEPYPLEAKEHLALIDRKLEEMRARAKQPAPRTLTGLIGGWREVIDQIEDGYEDNVYEYWNDVSVRDLLDEVLAVVPEGSVRAWVTKEVEELDYRYRRATDEIDRPIFGSGDSRWWWLRVPNVLVGELRDDLEQELGR
ncbi:MAG TPA: hypothetical protein VE596_17080 [Gaiellaceae bacterium]|jgi:hypothetical protein|nr:hypothetical protein [Gaiellaceae bacterium]